MKVYNFDGYELSYKNGLYGGIAGSKDGIQVAQKNVSKEANNKREKKKHKSFEYGD